MVAAIMTFLAVVVVLKAGYIMTVQKTYWQTVAAKVRLDSVLVNPLRGNILAAGNQRLACNLPEYRVYMDFQAIRDSKCDTLWHDSLGRPTKDLLALCEGLHRVFPSRSAKAFLDSLEAAYAYIDSKGRRKRCYPIWKRRIDYMTYKQLKELPIFCLGPYRSGFSGVELMVRNRPYGSLASSIVGAAYKESGKAYSGLELAYDTILAGTPGIKHRRKVLNKFINISDTAAVDGADLVSTIDVFVQDLAERSLKKELIKDKAYTGVAIVMEVETGDILSLIHI